MLPILALTWLVFHLVWNTQKRKCIPTMTKPAKVKEAKSHHFGPGFNQNLTYIPEQSSTMESELLPFTDKAQSSNSLSSFWVSSRWTQHLPLLGQLRVSLGPSQRNSLSRFPCCRVHRLPFTWGWSRGAVLEDTGLTTDTHFQCLHS